MADYPPVANGPVRFGVFDLDSEAGELRKRGVRIKLQDQPLHVLQILLEKPGQIVTREELKKRLWPAHTFVEFDKGIYNAIKRLRETLDDEAETPRYIETLPRRGYRFIAHVDNGPTLRTKPSSPPDRADDAESPIGVGTESAVVQKAASAVPRRQNKIWLAAGAVGIAAALVFGLLLVRQSLFGTRASMRIQSLAVLPLENLTGDPAQEYFADGMTDALTTDLAQYAPLRVISRTSAMTFKGTKKPLPQIARDLNVDAIVEGSVSRSGDHVRITAQLIRASTDRHLWAQAYDYDLKDILDLQREISRDIADQVEIKLAPEGAAHATPPRQVNPESYELYLKGRFYLAKRTNDGMIKSVEYIQEAIHKDPNFALAYAGLANAYNLLGGSGLLPEEEADSKSKAAAMRAMALDDTLPEALLAMAGALDDPAERERLYRRALQMNPSYAQGHHWYARFLMFHGRLDEATAEIEKARDLDPLSPIVSANVGEIYFETRKFDQAIQAYTHALALDPNSARAHLDLGNAYEHLGRLDDAIAEFQRARQLGGQNSPEMLVPLQRAYEAGGSRGYYQAELQLLKESSARNQGRWMRLATVSMMLGDMDQALAAMEKISKKYPVWGEYLLKASPRFDDLRTDPRFSGIHRRAESAAEKGRNN